jgi:hypothetical protein
MKDFSGAVRLPSREESVAPVTILDGEGSVVRVVPAAEFRRLHPSSPDFRHARRAGRRDRRRAEPPTAGLKEFSGGALAGVTAVAQMDDADLQHHEPTL